MDVKRYFWLKLRADFFKQRALKKLRRLAGGDTYTIIYLKILLVAMQTNGIIEYHVPDKDFEEELAIEIDEEEENVAMTIHFLINNDLAVRGESNLVVPEAVAMTGSENSSAERVRKLRARRKAEKEQALQCNTDVTPMLRECNKNVTTDIEIEKEIELELDIDSSSSLVPSSENLTPEKQDDDENNLSKIYSFWNTNIQPLVPHLVELIKALYEEVGNAALVEALNVAVENNAHSFKYIETCARNAYKGVDFKKPKPVGGTMDVKDAAAKARAIYEDMQRKMQNG